MAMEVEDPFPDELVLPETVLTMLDWPLPPPVEALLQEICREQSQEPPDAEVRRRLADIGEDGAIKILKRISCCTIKHLSSFIIYMVNRYPECISEDNRRRSHESTPPLSRSFSPLGVQVEGLNPLKAKRRLSFYSEPPPECSERGSSGMISEQLKLLSQLEFRKLFLILSYIGSRKKLEDVVSPNEAADILGIWGNLPMTEFESRIWNAYGRQNYDGDRPKYLDWDSGKTHMYYCNVDQGGNCTFKGVRLTTTRTHLQRALGDENVLCVRFPAENECCPKMIADEGILVGLRRYRFFVYKDEKEKKKNLEERKKDPTLLKCYFISIVERSNIGPCEDGRRPYTFSEKKINEARSQFMHVHTVPSIAKYIARFSLILSKTIKFPIDLANVDIQDIEDIPCRDANGHIVYDQDGEPRIHTDGTGYISEDLALKCPKGFRSAKFISDGNFEQFQGFTELEDTNMEGIQYWNREPPPLLMQFRMFNNGRAIKGTLLINKQIGPGKIQIRPSMVKVEKDPKILATSTFNSLEIVAISHKPRRANLSKFLILLLSYGGVPEEYFLALMKSAWEEIKTIYTDKRAALRAAVRYGETDNEFTTAKLISSGVPMDEPYLQDCLSRLANMEKDNLKTGKLPTSDSYYLMGTADPTGTLNSDEVCVILDNGHVTGKVLVYKHPGLHFGDIHIMNAKYVEELNHIVGNAKYGIFFSTKGPISAASEIANSDFDGDMYWVSMNPQLLTYYKASEPWSRIHAVPKAVTKRPSEFMPDELEYELLRVFLEGKKLGNNMAVAADGWLACMDQFLTLGNNCTKEKPADLKRKILHLIDLYYEALDAPKTGKTVNIPRKLMPEKYPHYMERRPSYQSTSVLGKLYDYKEPSIAEEDSQKEIWKLPCFEVEVPETCLSLWKERYHKEYLPEMSEAMNCGPPKSEARKVAANNVMKKYKQLLYEARDFEESRRKDDDIFNEALAIYHVCYDYAKMSNDARKCGFAWRVAASALCKYHAFKQKDRPILILPSILQEILR
ncbi:probable RNA-dependent RNA polymerase 5 isoform X2 [Ipomoea triloba]|uniref:probable RNA-dependent RNA polymerase 5 isoform X2 n=1 Tax=Ipomoea triloba TaxID=35885 RepID=UPI00125E1A6D|nr:probable RNA-dependent RNA polymerase 5 isoform X2 [Ipomoea triloba]